MPGNDINAVVLIPCTGADESTTFTDTSVGGITHIITAGGDAQVDTALESPFIDNEGVVKFDGTTDYLSYPTDISDALASDDFTIEARIYLNNTESFRVWQQFQNNDNRTGFAFTSTDGLFFISKESGSALVFTKGAWSPSIHIWYAVAIVRSGSTFKLFVDGVDITDSGGTYAGAVPELTGDTYVGRYDAASAVYTDGYLAELRVSNIARWTANYTPSTVRYLKLLSSQLDIKRNLRAEKSAGLDTYSDYFSKTYTMQIDMQRSLRGVNSSELSLQRDYKNVFNSNIDFNRNWRALHSVNLDILRDWNQLYNIRLDIRRHWMEETEYHLYSRNLATGTQTFLGTFDAAYELNGITVADGNYELIIIADGKLWSGCRPVWSTTLVVGESVPGAIDTVGLPVVQNLSAVQRWGDTRISWDISPAQDAEITGFYLWFGAGTPVITSGTPDETVIYYAGNYEYRYDYNQTAAKYLAIKSYNSTGTSAQTELFLPWSGGVNSPEWQYTDDIV